jgi:hypothetical protein
VSRNTLTSGSNCYDQDVYKVLSRPESDFIFNHEASDIWRRGGDELRKKLADIDEKKPERLSNDSLDHYEFSNTLLSAPIQLDSDWVIGSPERPPRTPQSSANTAPDAVELEPNTNAIPRERLRLIPQSSGTLAAEVVELEPNSGVIASKRPQLTEHLSGSPAAKATELEPNKGVLVSKRLRPTLESSGSSAADAIMLDLVTDEDDSGIVMMTSAIAVRTKAGTGHTTMSSALNASESLGRSTSLRSGSVCVPDRVHQTSQYKENYHAATPILVEDDFNQRNSPLTPSPNPVLHSFEEGVVLCTSPKKEMIVSEHPGRHPNGWTSVAVRDNDNGG